jgi:hypothetical protein
MQNLSIRQIIIQKTNKLKDFLRVHSTYDNSHK